MLDVSDRCLAVIAILEKTVATLESEVSTRTETPNSEANVEPSPTSLDGNAMERMERLERQAEDLEFRVTEVVSAGQAQAWRLTAVEVSPFSSPI